MNFSQGLSEEVPLMGYVDGDWLDTAQIFRNSFFGVKRGLYFTLKQTSLEIDAAWRDVKVLGMEREEGFIDTLTRWFTYERHSISATALAQRREIPHPFGDAKFDYWLESLCFIKDKSGDRLVIPMLRVADMEKRMNYTEANELFTAKGKH